MPLEFAYITSSSAQFWLLVFIVLIRFARVLSVLYLAIKWHSPFVRFPLHIFLPQDHFTFMILTVRARPHRKSTFSSWVDRLWQLVDTVSREEGSLDNVTRTSATSVYTVLTRNRRMRRPIPWAADRSWEERRMQQRQTCEWSRWLLRQTHTNRREQGLGYRVNRVREEDA